MSREDHPAALGTHAPSSPAQTRWRLAARRLDVGTPHAYTAPLQRGLCLVGGQGQCGLPTQEPVGKRWLLAEDTSSSCGQDPHVGPEKHLGENRENLRPHSAPPSSVARRYQPALRSALSWAAWPRDTQSRVPQESRVSHACNLEPVSLSAGPPRSCSTHFTPHLTDSHQECNINRPHLRPLKELLSAKCHTRQFPASSDLFGGSPAAHSCPTGSAPALLPRHR